MSNNCETKLDWALYLAGRGFKVFPVKENAKSPPIKNFPDLATTDEWQIYEWWLGAPGEGGLRPILDHNIAISTTDIVVVDMDVKTVMNEHISGSTSYYELDGHNETLIVKTPSGGYHAYFNGFSCAGAQSIRPGLDIRSYHGYVIAPGSTINGVMYDIVKDIGGDVSDLPWLPPKIEDLCQLPGPQRQDISEKYEHAEVAHSLQDIDRIVHYLKTVEPAIQGKAGDARTFSVAAALTRDYGLPVPLAVHFMLEYYNPRCVPPWQPEDIYKKVENSHLYGKNQKGAKLASNMLSGACQNTAVPKIVDILTNAPSPVAVGSPLIEAPGSDIDMTLRTWIIKDLIERQKVAFVVAPPGTGKSMFTVGLAAHAALGLDWNGLEFNGRKQRVVMLSLEDDKKDVSDRLCAVRHHYKYKEADVNANLGLIVADKFQPKLAVRDAARQPMRNEADINTLKDNLIKFKTDILVIDPFIKIHKLNEQDNNEMDFLMNIIIEIARDVNCAVIIVHHTRKTSGSDHAGDANMARGAGATNAAGRRTLTLMLPTVAEAAVMGINEDDREDYVRLDDGKANFSKKHKVRWFRKVSVFLPNGDVSGALVPHGAREDRNVYKERLASILVTEMQNAGTGSLTASEVVTILSLSDTVLRAMTDAKAKVHVREIFKNGVMTGDLMIQYVRVDNKPVFQMRKVSAKKGGE